jgi:hypothetical protein
MNPLYSGCAMILAGGLLLQTHAATNEFDAAVADVENAAHVHRTYIPTPLLGLVSFGARIYTHGSVHGLHVAELENVGDKLSQERFGELMEARFGDGWSRMIRQQDFESHELTLIYTRPAGEQMEMMVASLERNEISLVNVKVNPKEMQQWLNDRRGHGHGSK